MEFGISDFTDEPNDNNTNQVIAQRIKGLQKARFPMVKIQNLNILNNGNTLSISITLFISQTGEVKNANVEFQL